MDQPVDLDRPTQVKVPYVSEQQNSRESGRQKLGLGLEVNAEYRDEQHLLLTLAMELHDSTSSKADGSRPAALAFRSVDQRTSMLAELDRPLVLIQGDDDDAKDAGVAYVTRLVLRHPEPVPKHRRRSPSRSPAPPTHDKSA